MSEGNGTDKRHVGERHTLYKRHLLA